jgi:hypothetical protein
MEAAQEKLAAATSEEERQAAQQKLDELNLGDSGLLRSGQPV